MCLRAAAFCARSFVIAVIAAAQNDAPKMGVGVSAPELALEKLLQAPKDVKADWQSLRGKVVVLERGKRYGLGEFPRAPADLARNFWALQDRTPRPRHLHKAARKQELHGMYDVRNYNHMDVVVCAGVGGGSLIYANVTIQPPKSVLQSWPITWDTPATAAEPKDHLQWYDLARHAIGYGVLSAWDSYDAGQMPFNGPGMPAGNLNVNSGLSNIVTRSARLDPKAFLRVEKTNHFRIATWAAASSAFEDESNAQLARLPM